MLKFVRIKYQTLWSLESNIHDLGLIGEDKVFYLSKIDYVN